MTDLEDRLGLMLNGIAADVEPRPDLSAVMTDSRIASRARRPKWPAALAVAACVALVVGLVIAVGPGSKDEVDTASIPSPVIVRSTSSAARYVVAAEGWRTYDVIESDDLNGAINFTRTGTTPDQGGLELTWYPLVQYTQFVADRTRNDVYEERTAAVAGREALLFDHAPSGSGGAVQRLIWREGPVFFELVGNAFDSVDQFLAVASTLAAVDEATFRATLPPAVLQPADVRDYIHETVSVMLLPSWANLNALDTDLLTVRRDLDGKLIHAVTCAWIEDWKMSPVIDLGETVNLDRRAAAVDALRSAPTWPMYAGQPADAAAEQTMLADALSNSTSVALSVIQEPAGQCGSPQWEGWEFPTPAT